MHSSNKPILKIEKVTKKFGRLVALNHCCIHVEEGKIVGLIGPNGAGKTTLFNLISGFLNLDAGKVIFKEEDISRLKPYARVKKGIGRTFQITRIFSTMTVEENMIVAVGGDEKSELINELLELTGLMDLKNEYAGNLSFGQQKLLELIRVMMFDPELILLDEPAAGINPTLQNKILDLIHQLNEEKGRTFLVIEHDMDVIMGHCDKIIALHFGEKIAEGTSQEIRNNEEVLTAYFGR